MLAILILVSLAAVWWAGTDGPIGGVVALVRLEGTLTAGGPVRDWSSSGPGSDRIVSELVQAGRDPSVRAVVLRINSPGGSAAGAQEIALELGRLREVGKPVVASIADVGASGAYWVACGSDLVVVNPGSLTGSIGVYLELTLLEELYEKLGVDFEVFKSGPHKDMGTALRPPTDAERAILQAMVDDIFEQFVDTVAAGRSLDRDRVLELADGRLFTGRQAVDLGLADRTGNLQTAIAEAAALAGLKSYTVRELGRRHPLERLLEELQSLAGSLQTLAGALRPIPPGGLLR